MPPPQPLSRTFSTLTSPGVDSNPRSNDDESQSPSSRVCDNCIWKKVKCDQKRPTCSRCAERSYTCTYSSVRRRPGPARGSHRGSHRGSLRPRRSQRSSGRQTGFAGTQPLGEVNSSSAPTSSATTSHSGTAELGISGLPPDARCGGENSIQPNILPEEEEYLLGKYLELIHDAVPIFSKARFPTAARGSLYERDLVVALLVITAKLIKFTFAAEGFDLDARIDLMLSSGSLQEDLLGDSPSLDQFRKACLLAFYEFHQFPGRQTWMRIGKLTRTAYWVGLDRIDSDRILNLDFGSMSPEERDDWRLVWWCVYRLDSYVNLAAGTPYLIDEGLVNTALARDELEDGPPESQQGSPRQKLYLPSQPDRLWELVPATASGSQQTSLFNLHIITVTAMRQVGRVLRSRIVRPQGESLDELEQCLTTVRLALPTNYLNPMRNALLNETKTDHQARLVTVLHLLLARLLVSIFSCSARGGSGGDGDEEWLLSWQRVLETCQDIAGIAEQWNSAFSLSVDPAMSFINFTALIFLDLHKKAAAATAPGLHSTLEHCETVLLLQLEQFSTIWTLPRLLILSFKTFRELLVGPLARSHIHFVLSRFEAPLHPRWLHFLTSAPANFERLGSDGQ